MEALLEKTKTSKTESGPSFLAKCLNSFSFYYFYAFSVAIRRVEGSFFTPLFHKETCDRLEMYNRTSTVAPRFHLKSTVEEGHVSWKLLRMEHFFNEGMYFSYTNDLAAYHTKRLKRYIFALPELFGEYRNCTDSESVLHYRNADGRIFVCEPAGILTFQRGKHPHNIWADDILRDPQVRLDITQIEKIARTYFEEIEQMPKEGLHLVGTPQDSEDLFAQLEGNPGYNCRRYDAIVDEARKLTLWPQRFSWEKLVEIRQRIGEKAFNKEFRCMPVRGEEGYINLSTLSRFINSRLRNYEINNPPKLKDTRLVVGGFDIGKKTHPSHLSLFAESQKKLKQIHSKFMDGWDYNDQVDYLRQIIKNFKVQKLFYDNTRAEFEGFQERGELPGEMEGISFTAGSKFSMAAELDQIITAGQIELLDDARQKRQILTVDCDLKAPETQDGHGDAFFSLCLAAHAWHEASGIIIWSP